MIAGITRNAAAEILRIYIQSALALRAGNLDMVGDTESMSTRFAPNQPSEVLGPNPSNLLTGWTTCRRIGNRHMITRHRFILASVGELGQFC
jgi:hypothetical protein